MKTYSYYPGCSLTSTACEYDISFRLVAKAFDVELQELEDWNCCGASPAPHHWSGALGKLLPARNVHLAAGTASRGLVAPCAGCYNRLKYAQHELRQSEAVREQMGKALHEPVRFEVDVLNLVELLNREIDAAELGQKAQGRLEGLVLAPYYGCLLTRPAEILQHDNVKDPVSMEALLAATGAEVPYFPLKSECCGSYMGPMKKEVVLKSSHRLLEAAAGIGVDALVTACPLCQQNLDLRQGQINKAMGSSFRLPVLYLTQVIGLALGMPPDELGIDALAVSPESLLNKMTKK